jgi:hypothetical protein
MNKRAHHETIRCPDGCGRRTKHPATEKWLELTDWGVLSADDPRPPEAATTWFATARCLWQYGERILIADLGAAISGEAQERQARGEGLVA